MYAVYDCYLVFDWNLYIWNCQFNCIIFFSKDYMPFSDIYVSTFKNDIEYKQLLTQTAMALQTNKYIQVTMRNGNHECTYIKSLYCVTVAGTLIFCNSTFRSENKHFWYNSWTNFSLYLKAFEMNKIIPFEILNLIELFFQPLLARKNDLDRLRKDIKEQWQREQKKMVCNMSLF